MASPSIALLTDFGAGIYVGAMKAVILGIDPSATVFDITHDVPPQAVEEGAFLLAAVIPFLPPACICVAVVDPGVGTTRGALALQTPSLSFIGPDNGLLSGAFSDAQRSAAAATDAAEPAPMPLPPAARAVRLSNTRYFRQPVSNTFHGRDIFAPVAAHLATGVPLDSLGPSVDEVLVFPPWRARAGPDGTLAGRVLSVDRFGNLVTSVRASDLPSSGMTVEIAGQHFQGLSRTYQEGPEFVLYIGSSGYLELARRDASAAEAIGARQGAPVLVRPEAAEQGASGQERRP
jgi:S-adenosylmethionine hydrolase